MKWLYSRIMEFAFVFMGCALLTETWTQTFGLLFILAVVIDRLEKGSDDE